MALNECAERRDYRDGLGRPGAVYIVHGGR